MTDFLDERPPRVEIVHLKSQSSLQAQYNPIEVSEQLDSVWARMKVAGASSEELQYSRTKNQVINLAFNFDAKSADTQPAFGGQGPESAGGLAGALPRVVRNAPGISIGGQFLTSAGTVRQVLSVPGRIGIARRFLLACQYVSRGAQEVRDGAPSRLLLVWPQLYSITCRLITLKLGHTQFSKDMSSARFTANLKLEVDTLGERLTFEDVLANGTIRNDRSVQG